MQDGDQPTARAARPLVLPEVFDGQKSFDEWVSHFENVSAVNGWNDDDKLQSGSPEKHTWHLLN